MRRLTLVVFLALSFTAGCGLLADSNGESKQLPGPAWTGESNEGMSQAEAEAFTNFALYWWGPSFAGFNLQAILGTPDQVTFIYGRCTIPRGRDGGCASPLTIMVQPLCALAPQVARGAYPGPEETLRDGALVFRRDIPERHEATAMFWTGDAMVRVHVGRAPQLFEEALEAIRGLNRPIGVGDALPAPEFERCS